MMHCHNRTLALTFMTQFAMVKHNLEQAYGVPNGSGGTVTDALSRKIQSESCSHTDIRCRAHPLPPMFNRQHLLLPLSVPQWWCDASQKKGVTWVCTYVHKGPDYGFPDSMKVCAIHAVLVHHVYTLTLTSREGTM